MRKRKLPKANLKNLTFLFLILFAISLAINRAYFLNPDTDMWWMMATGRYIIENHTIPQINPFVIHEGYEIIIQQWLLAITNYTIYSAFGKTGLFLFAAVAYTLMLFLVIRYIRFFTESKYEKTAAVLIAGFLGTFFITTRPAILTISILLAQQIAILKYKQGKSKLWIWLLPVLSLIEINIHASIWPFFFILLLPHAVPWVFTTKEKIFKQVKDSKALLLPAIISLLIGLCNPYGIKGMAYLFLSYNSSDLFQVISELQEPAIISTSGIFIILTILLLADYFKTNKEDVEGYKIYMAAGTIILSSMHFRNMWFIIFGLIPLLCSTSYIEIGIQKIKKSLHNRKKTSKPKKIHSKTHDRIELTLSAILYTITLGLILSIIFTPLKEEMNPQPQIAVDYLNKHTTPEEVIIFTPFNLGGYLEWNGYKVYMDARPELFAKKINKKDDTAKEYFFVYEGNIDYKQFIDKYKFTHLLIEKESIFYQYMRWSDITDYKIVVEDNNFALYEKVK